MVLNQALHFQTQIGQSGVGARGSATRFIIAPGRPTKQLCGKLEGFGMAKNTGSGSRRGQQKSRFQLFNEVSERWDKYDGGANYLKSKKSPGPFKGVEQRVAKKPPRRS
jgi:hypothetical protein